MNVCKDAANGRRGAGFRSRSNKSQKYSLWTWLLCATTLAMTVATSGCTRNQLRHQEMNVALLETELRSLEDRNYELEDTCTRKDDQLQHYKDLLAKYQDGDGPEKIITPNADSEGGGNSGNIDIEIPGLGPVQGTGLSPDIGTSPTENNSSGPPPAFRAPGSTPSTTSPKTPPPFPAGNRLNPLDGMNLGAASARPTVVTTIPDEIDAQVTNLILNHRRTGGCDLDGSFGDEGITVVMEPRNSAGKYVALPGPVSVVVLDPARRGEAARVARWDFSAMDVAGCIKTSGTDRGIHLKMRWPNGHPDNSQLMLFTRYETVDGRAIDTRQMITVDRPNQLAGRWTPATSNRGTRLRRSPAVPVSDAEENVAKTPPESSSSSISHPRYRQEYPASGYQQYRRQPAASSNQQPPHKVATEPQHWNAFR